MSYRRTNIIRPALLKGNLTKKNTVRICLLVALLWAALAALTYVWLIPLQPKSDFLPRWYGARAMLHGTDPYTLYITPDMQDTQGLTHLGFLYPATITYTLLPFWLFPFRIASSLWCGLQLVFFSLLPLLIHWKLRWRPSPFHFALIVLLSIVGWPYSLNVYTLGQFTGLCLASLILAWWGISKGNHLVAALSLVLATTRPESAVITAAILVILLKKRQFATLALWLAVMAGILLLSLLQIGWWVPGFLRQMREYHDVGQTFWPPQLLGDTVLELVFVAGMIVWGVGLFRQTWACHDRDRQLLWGLSVMIVLALLLLPQTNDYTLVYLLLPIWLLLWHGRRSVTTPVLVVWLPVMSYLSKYGYESSGGQADIFLWLNEFMTPLVIAGLLTYEWFRYTRSAPLRPSGAFGRMAERAPLASL